MSEDNTIRDRVTRLETQMIGVHKELAEIKGFEERCVENQNKAFSELNKRLDTFINNEKVHLTALIESVRKEKRQSLSPSDWVKILVAIIAAAGAVLGIIIQYHL